MSAAVSPSSAEARIATPQLENLKAAKNRPDEHAGHEIASSRFWLMPTSPSRTESPPHGWRHVEDVGADPPDQLGQQDDVDADGEDGEADDRGPAQPVDEQPLDHEARPAR